MPGWHRPIDGQKEICAVGLATKFSNWLAQEGAYVKADDSYVLKAPESSVSWVPYGRARRTKPETEREREGERGRERERESCITIRVAVPLPHSSVGQSGDTNAGSLAEKNAR